MPRHAYKRVTVYDSVHVNYRLSGYVLTNRLISEIVGNLSMRNGILEWPYPIRIVISPSHTYLRPEILLLHFMSNTDRCLIL